VVRGRYFFRKSQGKLIDILLVIVEMVCVIGERSSTGVLEWDSKSEAIEALVVANHTQLPNPSMY